MRRFSGGVEINEATMALDLIDAVGPGGEYLTAEHTLAHFKKNWYPELMSRAPYEKWVAEGALVMPVHHRGWENSTLHKMDKFVTDDWRQLRQAHEEVGGFDGPLPELHTELGEIITGKKSGRENEKERIIDFNYGLAIEDVAMATEIYARAKAKGIGIRLPLMEEELPYA